MIVFATLFLGLFFGVVDVELVTADSVASIRLVLDGQQLCDLEQPPWQTHLDLGLDLAPHELVAIAMDAKGSEVGRARQWINRPRAEAEAFFVLEPGAGGSGRLARLTWQSAAHDDPVSTAISFDGQPLAVTDPERIEIPPYVPEQVHFMHAELTFPRGATAVADVALGGSRREDEVTNLTAVSILVDSANAPTAEDLALSFVKSGVPLRVAAVEEGPAEVIFVLTPAAARGFTAIESKPRGTASARARAVRAYLIGDPKVKSIRAAAPPRLAWDESFRIVGVRPTSRVAESTLLWAFPVSQEVPYVQQDLARVFARAGLPAPSETPLIGNAVGLAALVATAKDHRRAVVLLLGEGEEDESPLEADSVRGFLRQLHVPFFVWSLAPASTPAADKWGLAQDISTRTRFEAAVSTLSRHLDRQRIVWLEGTHLPQQIKLSVEAAGIRLAQ